MPPLSSPPLNAARVLTSLSAWIQHLVSGGATMGSDVKEVGGCAAVEEVGGRAAVEEVGGYAAVKLVSPQCCSCLEGSFPHGSGISSLS